MHRFNIDFAIGFGEIVRKYFPSPWLIWLNGEDLNVVISVIFARYTPVLEFFSLFHFPLLSQIFSIKRLFTFETIGKQKNSLKGRAKSIVKWTLNNRYELIKDKMEIIFVYKVHQQSEVQCDRAHLKDAQNIHKFVLK